MIQLSLAVASPQLSNAYNFYITKGLTGSPVVVYPLLKWWLAFIAPHGSELSGCQVPVFSVRALFIVLNSTVFDEHFGFEDEIEELAVQELIPKSPVVRFDPSVAPWRSRIDEDGLGASDIAPVDDGPGDELGSVIETKEVVGHVLPPSRMVLGEGPQPLAQRLFFVAWYEFGKDVG